MTILLILASASPARKRLLEQSGIDHKVCISNINEDEYSSTSVKDLVQTLALAKAQSVAKKIDSLESSNFLKRRAKAILGCDSLFELNGKVYGKPKNAKEAFDRWKIMSSQSGFIHTGHCLMIKESLSDGSRLEEFTLIKKTVKSTLIRFSSLKDFEINKYIESNEPINCAGAFSIDGIGAIFIESIEGCFSNVIGLSLPWLRKELILSNISFLKFN